MERLIQLISKITTKTIVYITNFVAIISIVLVFEVESVFGLYFFALWGLITLLICLIKAGY